MYLIRNGELRNGLNGKLTRDYVHTDTHTHTHTHRHKLWEQERERERIEI